MVPAQHLSQRSWRPPIGVEEFETGGLFVCPVRGVPPCGAPAPCVAGRPAGSSPETPGDRTPAGNAPWGLGGAIDLAGRRRYTGGRFRDFPAAVTPALPQGENGTFG